VLVLTIGIGTGTAFTMSCDLSALRPVEIGQNSFVYAADGSLLGSIPAEKNRQPVPLTRISPWLAKATVAVEDTTHATFWRRLVRWLVDGVPDPVSVTTAVDRVEPGEVVKLTGEVVDPAFVEVNDALKSKPERVNADPHGSWLVTVRLSHAGEAGGLLDASQYADLVK